MSNSNFLVSVFMLTYNHEKYVEQAIESILMQSRTFDLEIVIGDDCSTDRTPAILKSYQQKYPSIIRLLINEKNIGASANHKQTMAACKGKYIAVCEGDDYWTDTGKLQFQVDYLENNSDYSLTCHRVHYLKQDTGQLEPWGGSLFENNQGSREIDLENIFEPFAIITVSIVCRADVFNHDEIARLKNFKDIFMFALALGKGRGICFNRFMAVYRIHSTGIWSMKGEINNLRANAYTGISIADYFNGKIESLNRFAYDQARNCVDKIEAAADVNEYKDVLLHLYYTLSVKFWRRGSLSRKANYFRKFISLSLN